MYLFTQADSYNRLIQKVILLSLISNGQLAWSGTNEDFLPIKPTDTVAGEVFLQGQFIEIGINQYGGLGSEGVAPVGYHNLFYPNLAAVTDPGQDGWNVGEPAQSGDYALPGCPEIGWGLEWNKSGMSYNFNNFPLCSGDRAIWGKVVETSSGDTLSAKWEGIADGQLKVVKNFHFRQGAPAGVWVEVTLENVGKSPLDSLEYLVSLDPDQELDLTGNFTTQNAVVYQPGGGENRAWVTAKGLVYGITVGLYTLDARAKVSVEGFANRDPDEILDSPELGPKIEDGAIALAYRFGTLTPGQSANFTYAFAFTDNLDNLDEDRPTCFGMVCTNTDDTSPITAKSGIINVLCGTEGNDIILGRSDHDTICGMGGDDVIIGDKGHDRIEGGTGNDIIDGGDGLDMLDGGEGNDVLLGGNGTDWLFGGYGSDYLSGGAGGDLVNGGPDGDTCEKESSGSFLVGCETPVSSTMMSVYSLSSPLVPPELVTTLKNLGLFTK